MTKNVKSAIAFAVAALMICVVFVGLVSHKNSQTEVFAEEKTILTLQIDNPKMTVNSTETDIDENGTTPVIVNDRTLVPIRAIIETVDGKVGWEADTKTAVLNYKNDEIRLVIDSVTAYLNGNASELDTAPAIINDRTMLPIRFIAESFGFDVDWNGETRIITITVPKAESKSTAATQTETADAPVVYMTSEISPESLVEIYDALGFTPEGKVAVKMSTGESARTNYLRPELIGDLVKKVDGTIVECNTAYGGSRASTAAHREAIKERGLTEIADVDIMDEDGSMSIPIAKGEVIKEDFVGAHLANYDTLISLAHFKGHAMGGFGGAIKNMSIGVASSEGKVWIHSGGTRKTGSIMGEQDSFLECMAEASSGVSDYFGDKIIYINVMNRLSVDCDCDANPAEPEMGDIGILASYDPVALDQACVDLVYAERDNGARTLINRIESRNGIHTLEHAAEIGYGSRQYNLVSIDS